jgi:hypothetical protein
VSRFTGASLLVLLVTFTAAGRMQQSPPPASTPLVLDFYALGPDGTAVPGLGPADVTVKVDGRTRTVRSLRLVKQGDLPQTHAAGTPAVVMPPPFSTNNIAEVGRSFVLMIDDESFRPGRERPVHSAVRAFLGVLSRNDRVSLWTMPHGGMKVDLTRNHDQVAGAVQQVSGQGTNRETVSDAACRTRTSLDVTEHMLSALAGGEGPTVVILFTSSMTGPRRDAAPNLPPGPCELPVENFTRVGRAASSARAHFFVVQVEDLAQEAASRTVLENPLEGIEHLTGITGGTLASLPRTGETTLVNIARETASYYSAVVDGAPSDGEGTHVVNVDISKPDVKVRARPTLFVRRPSGVKPVSKTPAEMVRVADPFINLQLRASGFSSQNSPDGQMRIIAAAEPAEPGVKLTAMSAALFDTKGRMVAQAHVPAADLVQSPTLAALLAPEGTYRLRIAAIDTAGRSGAVDVDVVAALTTAGSLQMSSLVLGLSRNGTFQPRLQFGTEPVAIGYLDLLGAEPGARIVAMLEVSESPNGPAVARSRLTIEPTSDPRRFRVQGAIPIGALPAGDYYARAMVGLEGQPQGVVVRAFKKVQ